MRVTMRAQNRCRMTLETFATVRNPPWVFAKQASINSGGAAAGEQWGCVTAVRISVAEPDFLPATLDHAASLAPDTPMAIVRSKPD